MSGNGELETVAAALQAVEAQRASAQAEAEARLAEFDAEISRLQRNIENLQAQIATLREARAQAHDQAQADPAWQAEASRRIFGALRAQAGALAERTVAWVEATRALEARRAEALRSSEAAPLLEEYEQFRRDVEPTLASLPASYRSVLQAHHDQIKARLQVHLDAVGGHPEVDAPPLRLDVVFASDDDIVMLLTPVAEEVHGRWNERDADLQTRVAATVVEGLYTALRGTAAEAAEAAFGGHEGLLAMEVELDPPLSGVGERLRAAVIQAFDAAADIAGSRVELNLVEVPVDLLLPDDEGEEADA